MQGRRIGELGNFKTTTYIESEFKRLGLKPAGDSGTYFQNLPYGTLKVDSTVARLIAAGAPAIAGSEWIPAAAAAGPRIANDANVTDANAVFAGRWGDTTTALDESAIRGKVAVFVYNPPRGGRGGGGGGRGGLGTVRDQRASNAGAALILVASTDSTPRAIVSSAFASSAGDAPRSAQRFAGRRHQRVTRREDFWTAARPARSWRDRRAGERELDQPVHAFEIRLPKRHRDSPGLRPGARDRVRAVERAQRPRRHAAASGGSRLAARVRPRHASAGRERSPGAAERRATTSDRLVDRLCALDSSAPTRLDQQRGRRRRLGDRRAARGGGEVRQRASGALDHLRLAPGRRGGAARLEVVR